MPYKDRKSPAAIKSERECSRRYEANHREERRENKRERYWDDPEKERARNRDWKSSLAKEKRCVNCGKPKDRGNKDLCSACAPIHAISVAKYHRKIKEAAFAAYGGPICACCGESHFEFMSIDHIGGGGGIHRKELRGGDGNSGGGGVRLYLWLKRHSYPPGFRVLCRNCNCAIGEYGHCPHEKDRVDALAKNNN
jgi:hypothetical protein